MTRHPARAHHIERRKREVLWGIVSSLCVALAALSPVGAPATAGGPGVTLREVVDGLQAPLGVTHAPGHKDILFVLEQGGRIRLVRKGRVLRRPFLDITALTEASGERGLLGLAFHPRYRINRRFFVYYTNAAGDTVLAEYRRAKRDRLRADGSSARKLLEIEQPFANHNGGQLGFARDGYLYIASGDGGGAGDPMGNGQRLDTLLGKILRIDVDGARPYAIPPDNPFVGRSGAREEIWAYGLRNPWRFSFDRATGDLWIADVGQNAFEEVDLERAGSDGGVNYGWNVMEADRCFPSGLDCSLVSGVLGLERPVATYSHDEGCSVTGGYVYRHGRGRSLRGRYVFGDYCSGRIWSVPAASPESSEPRLLADTGHSISSFGEDSRGRLYLTDLSAGSVVEIVPTR